MFVVSEDQQVSVSEPAEYIYGSISAMTVRDWMNLGLRMSWGIFMPGWEEFVPQDKYPPFQTDTPQAAYEFTKDDLKRQEQWYAERGGQANHWLNRELDLSTIAPNGTHDVEYEYVTNSGVEPIYPEGHDPNEFPPSQMPLNLHEMYPSHTVVKSGIIVRKGMFDPISTAIACYQCVLHSYMRNDPNKAHGGIDHCHIEGLEWNGERFVLQTGS